MRRPALGSRIVGTIALAGIVAASAVSCGGGESGDEATTTDPAEAVTTTDGATSSTTEHATTTSEPSTSVIEADPAEADGETAAAIPYWSPVLAGITASSPPQPATCPADGQEPLTDLVPVPGSLEVRGVGALDAKAVFDPSTHSIVVVRRGARTSGDAMYRQTVAGRLDVCTGTWSYMNADFGVSPDGQAAWPNALVYDEDSDVLVAFTYDGVRVYDPLADEWLAHGDAMPGPVSAFYHPASGMIITNGGTIYAYDVERAEWLEIGKNILSSFGEV
ncbi:MAG: hypothetical protein MUQ27_08925, partial [Acidimicrobiia bacterium]|nr:hypothetical protein [Acidimicrobiia bacterium]